MNNYSSLESLLRCPNCYATLMFTAGNNKTVACSKCGLSFPINFGRPILLDPKNDVFSIDVYKNLSAPGSGNAAKSIARFMPSNSVNLSSDRTLSKLGELLAVMPAAKVLVVGGGRMRRWLDPKLNAGATVKVFYSDIDVNADVDLFCDGHNLPFIDEIFDAIVTTAVLEHVLYPEKVVDEIHRVLKNGGLLYSELPFMQQVHEGAYDFTRYTLSGHRRLMNGFADMDSGMVAGPGTVLAWTIENFAIAFFSRGFFRNAARATARILFSWLKYFDLIFKNNPGALDGASCTYFFGRKMNDRVPDVNIIRSYNGASTYTHT